MGSPIFDLDTMMILSTPWIDGGLIVVGVALAAHRDRGDGTGFNPSRSEQCGSYIGACLGVESCSHDLMV